VLQVFLYSGVATGVRGCGPHRAALARVGKGAKNAEN